MRIKFILLIAITILGVNSNAQSIDKGGSETASKRKEAAFAPGERLVFVGSYGAALIPTIEAGEAVIRVTRTMMGGVPALNVYGNATVYSSFKIIFDLNDVYQTWFDESTLLPLRHSVRLREGTYRFNSDYFYDWDNMEVNTVWQNLKRPTGKEKVMPLTAKSFDAVALFYNLRCEDISQFEIGEPMTLELVLEDTIRSITYKYLGKEQRRFRGLGTFNTLKFSCTIATSSGESFKDGTELFLWVTDDQNKMPLYVESPIKIGSVKGILKEYSGLKYPLDSKVK